MPSFGYAIYESSGLVLKASEAFLSLLGINSLEGDARISSLLDAGPGGDDSLFFRPGTVWATPKLAAAKKQRLRISIESLERERGSDSGLFFGEIDVVEGEEVAESKSDDLNFLTTVSHELRAPLNGIIGFTALLERSNLNEEQAAILQKMQSSNFLLKGLINDILEYSRIHSSRIDLSVELVRLKPFIEELSGLFSERAKAKKLELVSRIDAEANISVFIPKLRVAQIVTNLLSNAVKYTDRGNVVLNCSVLEISAGDRIVFKIEDTGPGIEAQDLPRIFEPFSQAGEKSGPAPEGTGLGLAISRGLALAMGGSLSYRKSSSGGSIFVLELPFKLTDELEGELAPEESKASRAGEEFSNALKGSDKRILVVEDNALNADIISHYLKDYGVAFELANNGREAVEACRENRYDLILMDIMLPKMDGYEATKIILSEDGSAIKPIIIGVTAKVFRDDQLRCFEVGMRDVINKPVDYNLLRKVLDKHMFGIVDEDEFQPVSDGEHPKRMDTASFQRQVAIDYTRRMSDTREGRRAAIDRALESLSELLGQIKDSAEAGDRKALERYAHSMKGNAALIGARNVSDLAKGLERIAATNTENLRTDHWIALLESSLLEVDHWACGLKLDD